MINDLREQAAADQDEPEIDLVEPGCTGRREMELCIGTGLEPVLVGALENDRPRIAGRAIAPDR